MRRRATYGTLAAMKPHQPSIRAEGKERHKSRSPAMRNACEAFICSGFRNLAHRLTVFPGAGIAGKFLPSEIPSKSFAWGWEEQKYGIVPTVIFQRLARVGNRSR